MTSIDLHDAIRRGELTPEQVAELTAQLRRRRSPVTRVLKAVGDTLADLAPTTWAKAVEWSKRGTP